MGRKKIVFCICCAIIIIALGVAIPFVHAFVVVSSLKYYQGESPIRFMSAAEDRLAFICENGDCYISGMCLDSNLFGDGDADGLKIPFLASLFCEIELPKKLMSNVEKVSLSYNTGVIIDRNQKLYYFDADNYDIPTYIVDGILDASACENEIYAVTVDHRLLLFSPNGESQEIMSNVETVKADRGIIWFLDMTGNLYHLSKEGHPSLVTDDVTQFSFYPSYVNGEKAYACAYIKSNGDLYIRGEAYEQFIKGDCSQFAKIKEGVAEISLMESGAVVRYTDGSICRLGDYYNEPAELFLYQDEETRIFSGYRFAGVVCLKTGDLMLWGKAGNAFGETITSEYPFTEDPYVIASKNNK